jgi:nucleoside-diphosphate-sugar epimerase
MKQKFKKALIIFGANSYIAKNILNNQKIKKFDIFLISRKQKKNENNYDYSDLSKLTEKLNNRYKFKYVLNLANNPNIAEYFDNELSILKKTFFFQNKIIKFCNNLGSHYSHIYLSSDRVFGKRNIKSYLSSKTSPIDPYAKLKVLNENLLKKSIKENLVIVRATNIYGPFQNNKQFLPSVIKQIKKNDDIKVGNINSNRDYIYIKDVVDALFKIFDAKKNKQVYHLSNRKENLTKILMIVKSFLDDKFDRKININYDLSLKRSKKYELGNFKLDSNLTRKYLGWKPKFNIVKGIEEVLYHELR